MTSSIKIKDVYDWVVLGDHPAALFSGCLAARLGLSTLILSHAPSAKVLVSQSGQCIDFERNRMMGLARLESDSGLVWEILHRFGLKPAEEELFDSAPGSFQLISAEKRFSLPRDRPALEAEFKREFSEAGYWALEKLSKISFGPILSFWRSFPDSLAAASQVKKGTVPRKVRIRPDLTSVTRPFAKTSRSVEIGTVLEALGAALGNLVAPRELEDLVHLFILDQTSASFRGGMSAYRDFLSLLAERAGAHVLPSESFNHLFIENGRLIEVQLSHQDQKVSVSSAIVGVDLNSIHEKLVQTGKKLPLKVAPHPSGWCFTLSVLLKSDGLQPGVKRYNLIQDGGAPPVEIEVASASDYGMKGSGLLLFIRTLLPFHLETLQVEYQRVIGARLLAVVARELPFYESNIEAVFPEFRNRFENSSNESDSLSRIYGFARLEDVPENLRRYGGKGIGYESGLTGLYLATGESYPEFGNFGPMVAAIESIHQKAIQSNLSGSLA